MKPGRRLGTAWLRVFCFIFSIFQSSSVSLHFPPFFFFVHLLFFIFLFAAVFHAFLLSKCFHVFTAGHRRDTSGTTGDHREQQQETEREHPYTGEHFTRTASHARHGHEHPLLLVSSFRWSNSFHLFFMSFFHVIFFYIFFNFSMFMCFQRNTDGTPSGHGGAAAARAAAVGPSFQISKGLTTHYHQIYRATAHVGKRVVAVRHCCSSKCFIKFTILCSKALFNRAKGAMQLERNVFSARCLSPAMPELIIFRFLVLNHLSLICVI